AAFPKANLYRDLKNQTAFGNFQLDQHKKLVGTKIASSLVSDIIDCTFNCVSETLCKSFNIAASPDSENLYLCELLDIDKHRVSIDDLQVNFAFNHYSPWRPITNTFSNLGSKYVSNSDDEICYPCEPGLVGFNCDRQGETCSEIKSRSTQALSGSYVIDLDGEGGYNSFSVYCDMIDKNGVGVTILSHDSEDRTLVDGFEEKGSYVRNVYYIGVGVSRVAQISGIPMVSAYCEQFIKYECKGSLLFRSAPAGWWVSRDSIQMLYWGGASPDDFRKCACGVATPNTCVDTSYSCNCDANIGSYWHEDSGNLTNKNHLPVIQLRFGDTGDGDEAGYHTLGKLRCYGMA
ncbi:unnamed protein product, partial [Porites evermanni]